MLEQIRIVGAHPVQGYHHIAGHGGGVEAGGQVDNHIICLPHGQHLGKYYQVFLCQPWTWISTRSSAAAGEKGKIHMEARTRIAKCPNMFYFLRRFIPHKIYSIYHLLGCFSFEQRLILQNSYRAFGGKVHLNWITLHSFSLEIKISNIDSSLGFYYKVSSDNCLLSVDKFTLEVGETNQTFTILGTNSNSHQTIEGNK